ncbi:MAG: hypothetical protein B7Y02_04210, partial [Rhodobacterales bacterium 17-64-5]
MGLVAGLAACTPMVPESNPSAGAGFQDYNSYIRNSTAQFNGAAQATPNQAATGFSTDAAAAAITAAEGGATTAPLDPTGQTTGIQTTGTQTTGTQTAGTQTTGTQTAGTQTGAAT